MKIRLLYLLFGAAMCGALFLNNSGGAASVQRADRTGSPLSTGTCGRVGCHDDGSFNPSISVRLQQNGTIVDTYMPGETYTLSVQIASGGSPTRYGFQTVALQGNEDANAGEFGDPPTGFSKVTLSERVYVEHNAPRNNDRFEVEWTAPTAGTGTVRFYASGIAANGNGSSSGDGVAALASPLTIVEAATSSIFGVETLAARMHAYPNPVANQLNLRIQIQKTGRYFLSLFDHQGKEIQRQTLHLQSGENLETLNASALAAGHYFVRLSDGDGIITQKILKK